MPHIENITWIWSNKCSLQIHKLNILQILYKMLKGLKIKRICNL